VGQLAREEAALNIANVQWVIANEVGQFREKSGEARIRGR